MAILVSSETLKIIKTLTDAYHITKAQAQSKRKQVNTIKLNEILKESTSRESQDMKKKLILWFMNLNISQRLLAFLHCNPIISAILIQMHIYKCHNGTVEFSLLQKIQKKSQDFDLKSCFNFKKISPSKSEKAQTEAFLERNLLFFDSEEYCDSLCLSFELFSNPGEILKIFNVISNGNCFKVPCKAYWNNNIKKWAFEYPFWHKSHAFNSLAAWACASFERNIWINFWKMNAIDPRFEGETQEFDFNETTEIEFEKLLPLTSYFKAITQASRLEIIGNHEKNKEIFLDIQNKLISLTKGKIANFCGPSSSQAYLTMNTSDNYQHISSLDTLAINITDKQENFADFLFYSPLNRIGSIFDIVLRIIGIKAKEIYHTKLSQEIIFQEHTQKNVHSNPKPKLFKSRTNKRNNNQKNYKKNEEIEAAAWATKRVMDKIMINLYQNFKEEDIIEKIVTPEDAEFQLVNQRKNKRPQPQQKSHNYKVEPYKPKYNSRPIKNSSSKPKSIPIENQKKSNSLWECSPIPSLIISNEVDFPPLSSAIKPSENTDTLHHEIVRYSNIVIKKVQEKKQYISLIIQKINSIVAELFGGFVHLFGSYATGFAIESSDIDLAVIGIEFQSRNALQDACIQLANALEHLPFVITCKSIITAKIPVIKLEIDLQIFSGISSTEMIDITFVDSLEGAHLGIEAISFTQDLLILFPHIQFIALVLKNFLYSNNLNSAYHGNIKYRWA